MSISHAHFCARDARFSAPIDPAPELLQELYDTWLSMRNLLEEYGPSWYPETLRQRVESVAKRITR